MNRIGQVVKWLAALCVAVAFFVGIPFGLLQVVGSPLPDAGTTLSGIVDMLFTNEGVADSTVIKVAAVVAWLAWAHLAYVGVREAVSVARATVPPAIRGGSLTQRLVRPVVSTLFYLGGASSSIVSMAPVAGAAPAMEQVVVPLSESLGDVDSASTALFGVHGASAATIEVFADGEGEFVDEVTAARQGALVPDALFYEVQAGDNLWDIAEAHLGDGQRWREIYENSSSYDQLEGGRLNDEDMIHPQWILQLPGDAVDVPEPDPSLIEQLFGVISDAASDVVAEVDELEVEAGDGELAESEVEADTGLEPEVDGDEEASGGIDLDLPSVAAVVITPVDTDDVDSEPVDGGPLVEYSEEAVSDVGESSVVAPGDGVADVSAPVSTAAPVEGEVPEVNADEGNMVVAGLAAAGLLAATGLAGFFFRRHRVQMRDRLEGEVVARDGVAADARRRLTGGGNDELAAWLYAAFDSLAVRSDEDLPVVAPAMFSMPSAATLEAVFVPSGNAGVADPWRDQSGTGKVWQLGTDVEVGSLGPRNAYDWAAPAVVAAGDGVWLNLEWFGLAAVQGDDEEVGRWLRSICTDIKFGPAASLIDLKVSDTLVDRFGHLALDKSSSPVSSFEASLATPLGEVADDEDFDAYDHRVNGPEGAERFGPAVLLVDAGEADQIADLVELAERDGSPVVVLVVGDYDAAHVFTVANGSLQFSLGEMDLVFAAASMAADDVEAFGVVADAMEAPLVASPVVELVDPLLADPRMSMADEALGATDDDEVDVEADDESETNDEQPESVKGSLDWVVEHAALSDGGATLVAASDAVVESDDDDDSVEDPAAEEVIDLTDDSDNPAEEQEGDNVEPFTLELPPVMVNILGEAELVGAEGTLNGKQFPLIAYLAINGKTTGKQLKEVFYPGEDKIDKSFQGVVRRAREVLGKDAIASTKQGLYWLREDIGCDWPIARELFAQAKAETNDEHAVDLLMAGLGLVRGRPLGSLQIVDEYWDWVFDHDLGIMNEIEVATSDAALRLSRILRQGGELETALEVCVKGRQISKHWTRLAEEHVLLLMLMGRRNEALSVVVEWEDADEELTDDEPCPDVRRVLTEFVPMSEKAVS